MTLWRSIRLRHLLRASWLIALLGVALLVIGLIVPNGELWQLMGLLLGLAGFIKVAVIHVWVRLAGMETDRHSPIIPPN